VVTARRRGSQLIGDKEAAKLLFDSIAGRYVGRPGGYTRILRLATPRLGDAGQRAILELVGKNDRVSVTAEKPAFDDDESDNEEETTAVATASEETSDE